VQSRTRPRELRPVDLSEADERGVRRLDRVGPQVGEVDPLERLGVGGFEHDFGCNTRFERFDPAASAQAPAVAGREPVEAVFGPRRAEIIALFGGELEKRVRHHGTHW